jgi:hypothetical protein
MGKKIILGTGLLIGVYLVSAYATGFGTSLKTAGDVYVGGVKVLQGR